MHVSFFLRNGAVYLALGWKAVEGGGQGSDQVCHGAITAARRAVVKVLADVGSSAAQQRASGRQFALLLWFGAAERRVSLDLHLVVKEDSVGGVDETFNAQRLAHGRDRVVFGQQGEDHHALHKELPVLGLRNGVQHRFHLQGKLELPRGHLLRQILRQQSAFDD